jgi:hypothetical protein
VGSPDSVVVGEEKRRRKEDKKRGEEKRRRKENKKRGQGGVVVGQVVVGQGGVVVVSIGVYDTHTGPISCEHNLQKTQCVRCGFGDLELKEEYEQTQGGTFYISFIYIF